MITLYVVTVQGVYCKGVLGVFTTLELAKKQAKLAAETDVDDYHTYDVTSFQSDVIAIRDEKYKQFENVANVFSIKKGEVKE